MRVAIRLWRYRRGLALAALGAALLTRAILPSLRLSILDDIGGFLEGVGRVADEIVKLAGAVWRAFGSVWTFLTQAGTLVFDAWQWMVNGVEWLFTSVGNFAGEAVALGWHILTEAIPNAIVWLWHEAMKEARTLATDAYNLARSVIHDLKTWLEWLINHLVNAVKGALHTFVSWAEDAIKLVRHWGSWIVNLLSHPDNIARWVAGSIIEPVVRWFLAQGATVIEWLFQHFAEDSTAVLHILEDALDKVL